jgi:hypothetical protein
MTIFDAIRIRNRSFSDFLTCLIILVSHFSNYIMYSGYTRIFPDIFLVIICLCVIAAILTGLLRIPSSIFRVVIFAILITVVLSDALFEFGISDISIKLIAMVATLVVAIGLVFFLRAHTNKVLISAFLAILFSTLVIGAFDKGEVSLPNKASVQGSAGRAPITVHLILDEHLGLAGMTSRVPGGDAIRREIQQFYARFGFRVFSHAYSQYFETWTSLAGAMNFDASDQASAYLTRKRFGYSLDRNAYLKSYSDLGYNINIYQSNYIDFCAGEEAQKYRCTNYKIDNIDREEIAPLPVLERVRLLLDMYYSSVSIVKITTLVEPHFNKWLERKGIDFPRPDFWHGRVGPLAAMPSFEQLITDVTGARDRSMFFAHLLVPHYPYVYGATCRARSPISSWELRSPNTGPNAEDTRRKRHVEYFNQIRCTVQMLERLFEAMQHDGTFDAATIIVHGDHGSRIGLLEPSAANLPAMSIDDYLDGYSTLFAIKAPGVSPGIDGRMLPLPNLMSYAMPQGAPRPRKLPQATAYAVDGNNGHIEFPLPEFPPLGE